MIKHEILQPEGILIVEPLSALAAEDFQALASEVNTYLAGHPDLHGILIHARAFPGWDSFAAFVAHIRFIRDVHRRVERVALVSDSPIATVGPAIAKHFVRAQFRHFPYAEYDDALRWLTGRGASSGFSARLAT